MELHDITVSKALRLIREGKLSARELTLGFLSRIKQKNNELGAYITVCEETALKTAKEIDEEIKKGVIKLLSGLPVSVKDNICTKGIRTTCASKMLESYVPPYNATCAEKIISNGGIIIGKTNHDEFAMGSFGDSSAFFQTKNPLDTTRAPGGSSSGAAVTVAESLALAAIASDTGGSARIPAAFCGLVGFKPSRGAISRYGLIAYASSLDTVGVITQTVSDARLVSSAIAGKDSRDMTSLEVKMSAEETDLSGITFAFSELDLVGVDKDICTAVLKAVAALEKMGAKRKNLHLFGDARMDDSYKILACAEAMSNLSRYDGIKYGGKDGLDVAKTRASFFGYEVLRRIDYGNFVLKAENYEEYYVKATEVRREIIEYTKAIFKECDVIVSPLCDFLVPKSDSTHGLRPDRFTVAANFTGVPAICLPAGKDRNGMPVSVQLMSEKYSDAKLLSVAKQLEQRIKEEGI